MLWFITTTILYILINIYEFMENLENYVDKELVQYIFWDDFEEIATKEGKLIAVKDSNIKEYLPVSNNFFKRKFVRGSTTSLSSLGQFSVELKKGQHLIHSWYLGYFSYASNSVLKEINENFSF